MKSPQSNSSQITPRLAKKTWLQTTKADVEHTSGPQVYSGQRWSQDAVDRHAWSAFIRDAVCFLGGANSICHKWILLSQVSYTLISFRSRSKCSVCSGQSQDCHSPRHSPFSFGRRESLYEGLSGVSLLGNTDGTDYVYFHTRLTGRGLNCHYKLTLCLTLVLWEADKLLLGKKQLWYVKNSTWNKRT